APTSGYKKGTGSQSTAGGRRGRLLPCRTCSTHVRRSKSRCLPCVETSRRATQRMRGPDGSWLFSCSGSRSKDHGRFGGASERAHMPHSGLSSCRLTHRASELGLRFIECSPPVPPPEQPARAWLCTAPDASGRGQTESSPPSRRDRFGISCSSRTGARRTRGLPAQPDYYLPRMVKPQARGDEKSPLCFRSYGSYPCSEAHHTACRCSVFWLHGLKVREILKNRRKHYSYSF